jgi:uncharacterized caspase-like protein
MPTEGEGASRPILRAMLAASVLAFLLLSGVSSGSAQPKDVTVDQMRHEKRVALVIGNSAYPQAPLRNPVNDGRAMANVLRSLNFEVLSYENLSEKNLRKAIDAFGAKLRGSGVGLFYYSGHGLQMNGKNYLVPVDAKIDRENEVEYEAVDVGRALAKMEGVNRLNIVILDACRNNPFERAWRSTGGGLAQMTAPSGTFIAYATAPGRLASDGSGTYGLYTGELLKAMRTPGLSLHDVFMQTGREVKQRTNGSQEPWVASSVYGQFFFALPSEPAPVATIVPAKPPTPSPTVREEPKRKDDDRAKLDAEKKQLEEERRKLAELRAEREKSAREERERADREQRERLAALQSEQEKLREELADARRREEERRRDEREREARVQREREFRKFEGAWTTTKRVQQSASDGKPYDRILTDTLSLRVDGSAVQGYLERIQALRLQASDAKWKGCSSNFSQAKMRHPVRGIVSDTGTIRFTVASGDIFEPPCNDSQRAGLEKAMSQTWDFVGRLSSDGFSMTLDRRWADSLGGGEIILRRTR